MVVVPTPRSFGLFSIYADIEGGLPILILFQRRVVVLEFLVKGAADLALLEGPVSVPREKDPGYKGWHVGRVILIAGLLETASYQRTRI